MIVETGQVKHIADGKAVVEIERGTACAECHAECARIGETSTLRVEARDPIGVHVDQYVQLTIQNTSVLRASFVVYILPLCALIFGVLLGEYLGRTFGIQNILEILVGFGCLGLSLFFVKFYDALFKRDIRNQPIITKIIDSSYDQQ